MNKNYSFICMSDTHSKHEEVPIKPCDFLLFAGDFMSSGYRISEVDDFLNWFNDYPSTYKIMIAGNHDRFVENHYVTFKEKLKEYPDIIYLQEESCELEGIKFYGIPHTKYFYNWAFNRLSFELDEIFNKIPLDTNILLTHGPQYGILDHLENKSNVGEKELNKPISNLKNLKYHIHGHIHNAYGIKKNKSYTSINAAVLNEQYEYQNAPIKFIL